jgi:tetratricopeptide (TPR) repeat protein
MKTALLIAALSLAAAGYSAAPAFAAGSDSDANTPSCPKGQVYNNQKKSCVSASSGLTNDRDLAANAYALAKSGHYEDALATLDLMKDPNTAVALNYRGYATRKLGHTDEGIGYYLRSVALDPNYVLVREYLGEAYVIKGDITLAKDQLNEIEKRCGTTCESYQDLAEAIQSAI